MFGKKGKSILTEQSRCLGKENYNVSSITAVSTVAPYELVDSLKQYSLEVELKKAEVLAHWHRVRMRV